jgi:hypothetical protein
MSTRNVNDVEKRWHDPAAFRRATKYVIGVVVLAAALFAVYALVGSASIWLAAAIPAMLFLGALGAFVKTYLDWRAGRTWVMWHGAGWFLLALTLLTFALPYASISALP